MAYPTASAEQIDFFNKHGWLVVEDAIPQADLDELEHYCDMILERKGEARLSTGPGTRRRGQGQALVPHRAVVAVARVGGSRRSRVPQMAGRVRLGADGLKLEFWYDQFSASRRARARRPTGTRTKAIGAAICATRAPPAGSRCTT